MAEAMGNPEMMAQMNGMMGQSPMSGEGMDPMALAAQSQPAAPGPEMMMGMPPEGMAEDDSEFDMGKWVDFALMTHNLVPQVDRRKNGEDILIKMGDEVVRGYEADERSREGWMKNNEEWLKLALLVQEPRTFPWPKSSNVKYPLIATAAMQFSARAYPSLVPQNGKLVASKIPMKHANTALYEASQRVSNHMSFQLLHRMPKWEEDMDKLLMTIAIQGLCFKKTVYDSTTKSNRSYLVWPQNLCVNYFAKDLESAYRKTEILYYRDNEIEHKIRLGEFVKFEYESQAGPVEEKLKPVANKNEASEIDGSTPHTFYACHTYWDLDDDGYEEPYVITVHAKTKKVVRITARFDMDGIVRNEKGQISYIQPVEFFTDFPFIPNPDGSLYALGFGALLGPLNISINTLINQLVDAGTLNNLQSGFIGKGLRIKHGEQHLRPGEWKVVNATGDDLSKSIFPMPSKEPSPVLFQLMQMLIQSGNQLASIAEIFVGKMPGQNTPATTTQETVQQSMAVFTAIYKRVYRSLEAEYKKLYRLNRLNPDMIAEEREMAGVELKVSDYDHPDYHIIPGADPAGDSWAMKQQKMQFVGQLMQMGTINPQVYTKRVLTDLDLPEPEELMQPPPQPQPDPKAAAESQKMQMEMQLKKQDAQAKEQDRASEREHKEALAALELRIKELEFQQKEREGQQRMQQKAQESQMDMVDRIEQSRVNSQIRRMDVAAAGVEHSQRLRQNEESFNQKQKQTAQSQKAKPKEKGKPAK